jgi:hypothetical protein
MFEIVLENQWQILRTLSALALKLGADDEVLPLAQRIAATERDLIALREAQVAGVQLLREAQLAEAADDEERAKAAAAWAAATVNSRP